VSIFYTPMLKMLMVVLVQGHLALGLCLYLDHEGQTLYLETMALDLALYKHIYMDLVYELDLNLKNINLYL